MNKFYSHLFIALVYTAGFLILERWKTTLYYGDSNSYYLHVVSFFKNCDVGDYDQTITSLRKTNPNSADPREDKFGIRLTPIGKRYIKYPVGVAIMETPFYFLADAVARFSGGKFAPDAWSVPYLFIVGFSSIVFLIFGFWLLWGILERYFPQKTVQISILTLALATNLFYFSTYVTMAHVFLFFDYCVLLWLTHRFYENPTVKTALGIGAMVGLITITRIPELISAFIPFLWGITSWPLLRKRVLFFTKYFKYVLAASIGFVLLLSIQVAYWYFVSGKFFFNPYTGEGFDFKHPHIFEGWLSFSNGWLIYTPVMILSLLGLLCMRGLAKNALLPLLVFVGLHIYIHYSYYAWTFFPGLGSRPMVETYALFAFPLTAFLGYLMQKIWSNWLFFGFFGFCTWLNFFQTWQMREGKIWSERGNRAFYLASFGTMTLDKNALIAFDSGELQPDTNSIKFVKTLGYTGFEDSTEQRFSTEIKHAGKYGFLADQEFTAPKLPENFEDVQEGDWIRVRLFAYFKDSDRRWQRDGSTVISVIMTKPDGKHLKNKGTFVCDQIGNPTHSIWSSGEPNQWGEVQFFVHVRRGFDKGSKLRAFIWNPNGQKIYVDDFSVELWRQN